MYFHTRIITFVVAFCSITVATNAMATDREKSICGFIKEPFVFWAWNSMTPKPSKARVTGLKNIEKVDFRTTDKKTLSGYKYYAHDDAGKRIEPKGYVLMALGNAMLADQVIVDLVDIAASGHDVYIYDYRGYGNSEGKRRLNAILEDFREIATALNPSYKKRIFYGVSLGAAVISNLLGTGIEYDAAILDSGPSRLSPYGCPKTIDPIENLPKNAEKILVITGDKDTVLGERMTGELRRVAEKRGAKVIKDPRFAHPFMDTPAIHRIRMDMVKEFVISMTTE